MKNRTRALAFFAVFFALSNAWAVSTEQQVLSVTGAKTEATPRDLVELETGYVFESDLHHGANFGKQYEIQNSFAYGHRFLLNGNLYLHVGLSYDRFDFGSTGAPVPRRLQAAAGVIGIDYMHDKDVGAFIQVKPGFYTEGDFGKSSFDAPITGGRIFVLQPDKTYLFVGVSAAFLRGWLPVLPIAGLIWMPNDKLRVMVFFQSPGSFIRRAIS